MKTGIQNLAKTLGLLLAGALLPATAFAQCPGGAVPKARLHRQASELDENAARLIETSSSTDPIVGFWRFQFLIGSEVFDHGTAQWHSDNTEIMNSSRNPETQSCLCTAGINQ